MQNILILPGNCRFKYDNLFYLLEEVVSDSVLDECCFGGTDDVRLFRIYDVFKIINNHTNCNIRTRYNSDKDNYTLYALIDNNNKVEVDFKRYKDETKLQISCYRALSEALVFLTNTRLVIANESIHTSI